MNLMARISIGCFLLASCASGHLEEQKQMAAAKNWCRVKYPLSVGNYYNRALCIDAAEFAYVSATGDGNEYAQARAQIRDRLSKKVDKGEITNDEFELRMKRDVGSATAEISAQEAQMRHEQRQKDMQGVSQSMLDLGRSLNPTRTNCSTVSSYGVANTNCVTYP